MIEKSWECYSTDQLSGIAQEMLEVAGIQKLWAFYGEMGAGKTTLIKELCACLGAEDLATSPTFSIVNEYRTPESTVYHFDFYRLKDESEAFDMGYEEYFYSGNYCFVEWPEKVSNLLPDTAVKIKFAVENHKRIITLLP